VQEEQVSTHQEFLHNTNKPAILAMILVIITFNAGWVDALCYLYLDHVFGSFMTANFLFIGLGAVQNNQGLLVRAFLAVLVYLFATMCGSMILWRVPLQQTRLSWLKTFARYLLIEWVILCAFALLWQFSRNPAAHSGTQITLLVIVVFAMGIQGALVESFNFPGVVANALTATVLLIGQRLAQDIDRRVPRREEPAWKRYTWFLFLLCIIYIVSAILVVVAAPYIAIAFVPLALITLVLLALYGWQRAGAK
jgi:uncharacterized membrane protein YoaK (UPF0700 family)